MPHRCSIACIIPPVLLEELARRGDKERDSALRTLSIDATLRAARVHNSLVGTAANPTSVLQSVTPGKPGRAIFDCQGSRPPESQDRAARGKPREQGRDGERGL